MDQWRFNKRRIDVFCFANAGRSGLGMRKTAILQLYKCYIEEKKDLKLKFSAYQLAQCLLTMPEKKFRAEYGVKNEKDVKMFVQFLKEEKVRNVRELCLKTVVAAHVERSEIFLEFSDTFKLEDITGDIAQKMMKNIKNRLQLIKASQSFILLYREYENNIFASMITDDNEDEITELIKQCNGDLRWDVIICTHNDVISDNALENVYIRHLNYIYTGNDDIELILTHPDYLVSATLDNVKINIKDCVNLNNLYSQNNTYTYKDLQISNLKRIFTHEDKYKNDDTSLIEHLFENNKLEYVFVENEINKANIIGNMELSQRIANLRHLYIYQKKDMYDNIIFDITNEFPENIRVCFVVTDRQKDGYDPTGRKVGMLKGNPDDVNRMKQNLIHEPPENK